MIESTIYLKEKVRNKDRKFGANLEYFPTVVKLADGQEVPALFTENEIDRARERAKKNPEDCQEKKKSFWESLLGG